MNFEKVQSKKEFRIPPGTRVSIRTITKKDYSLPRLFSNLPAPYSNPSDYYVLVVVKE